MHLYARFKQNKIHKQQDYIMVMSSKNKLPTLLLTGLFLAGNTAMSAANYSSGQASANLAAPSGQRPNIVFIFSDDHSLQTIGAYNWRLSEFCREHNITPNIDRLAEQGGIFENSYCGNSICAPSRATVLTGLHSHAHGVRNILERAPIHPHLWTFPDGLREIGYQSCLIGKFHIQNSTPTFDEWSVLPGQGDYYNPRFIDHDGTEHRFDGYVTDIITDRSIEWLRQRDTDKPFFLAVQHKAPHRIWEVPEQYAHWLDDVHVPEPETLFEDFSGRTSAEREARMTIADDMRLNIDLKIGDNYPRMWSHLRNNPLYRERNREFARLSLEGDDLTRWKYQLYLKDYLRTIKSMDDNIGRILDELKAQGLADNTIVIYSSDQGFFMGEHGWFDKRWIYKESVHMPFIIRWPGVVQPGTRFQEMIQNIDYAATFMEMAEGQAPDGLHGRSFVPVLRGETPSDWRQSIYYNYFSEMSHNVAQHYGVVTDRYTLFYSPETRKWQLFDEQKDPHQVHNMYADPAYAGVVEELKTELSRLREHYGDTEEVTLPTRHRPRPGS
jgi:arylsulfatase A-like enzyme